jgi:hypothetical protein
MLTVIITLTTAGADTGNFDLYSNVDGYTAAFETGVLKTSLQAGYTSYLVPNGTTIIRVKSDTICQNYVDIVLVEPTTTTTTTTVASFNAEIRFTTQHVGGDYEIYVDVYSGTLLDTLTSSGTVQGYTDTGCSISDDTGTFSSLSLSPGPPGYAFANLSGNPHNDWQSRKITSLTVNGNVITNSPEIITVGSNTYNIIGWQVCQFT